MSETYNVESIGVIDNQFDLAAYPHPLLWRETVSRLVLHEPISWRSAPGEQVILVHEPVLLSEIDDREPDIPAQFNKTLHFSRGDIQQQLSSTELLVSDVLVPPDTVIYGLVRLDRGENGEDRVIDRPVTISVEA